MRNLPICLIVIIFSNPAFAQNQMGAKIGANMVMPKFDNPAGINVSPGINYSIGLFYSKGFTNGNKLRTELNYYTNFDTEFEESGVVTTLKETSFITIPINYGLKIGKIELYALMGVYAQMALNNDPNREDVYNYLGDFIRNHEGWTSWGSSENSFGWGFGANIGLEYYVSNFSINAYYQLPFITIPLYELNDEYKLSFSHAGLSVGYNFIR